MSEGEEPPPPPINPVIPGLALLGVGLLTGGIFCPAIVLPSGATRSYYDLPWVDGNIVLGSTATAFVLTWVFRWFRGLFVVGGLALFILATTLLKVSRDLPEASLTWGWLPLVAGTILLLAAAVMAHKERPQRDTEAPEEVIDEYD